MICTDQPSHRLVEVPIGVTFEKSVVPILVLRGVPGDLGASRTVRRPARRVLLRGGDVVPGAGDF